MSDRPRLPIRLITFFVLALLVGGWIFSTYNGLVRAHESLQATWSQVETQYQRRFDLVPNLESIVKGAANFEQDIFTTVAETRTQWSSSTTQTDKVAAINRFDSALSRLLVTVENYPTLTATQVYRNFQAQLEGTENKIAAARRDYNAEVRDYNVYVKIFPRNLLTRFLGFESAAFFQAAADTDQAPAVSL